MAELKQVKEKGYSRSYNNFSLKRTSVSAPEKKKMKKLFQRLN